MIRDGAPRDMLVYFPAFAGTNKHFVASSIKDLFENVEAHNIIDFIKETRFYKQL